MSILPFSKDLFNFDDEISKSELQKICADPKVKCVQTSTATKRKAFELINDYVAIQRPDILIRLYGYYKTGCDLSVLSYLKAVKRLSIDCMLQAENISYITELPLLNEVSVGIFNIVDFEFLAGLPSSIISLGLHATKSKKPMLKHLQRFKGLQTLYLEGQQNHIEAISNLHELQDLTLRSISTPNIDYLSPLKKIRSLDIKLGGIKNFNAAAELANLKYLELWHVRNLSSLEFLGKIKSLQYLFLQDLPLVKKLPQLTNSVNLRRIHIQNLKGLTDFSCLSSAPALEDFALIMGQKQTTENLEPLLRNKSLKKALLGFGKKKEALEFAKRLEDKGVKKFTYEPFQFH